MNIDIISDSDREDVEELIDKIEGGGGDITWYEVNKRNGYVELDLTVEL